MIRPCVNLSMGPSSLLVPIGSSRRKKRKTLSPASRGRLSLIFVPIWTSRPSGEAELEELYTRPYEDIAVEEFLEKLPSPQVEEILEPEKDTPMDASEATAEAAHSPPGETADSTVETPDVPMKTEAPEGYPIQAFPAENAAGMTSGGVPTGNGRSLSGGDRCYIPSVAAFAPESRPHPMFPCQISYDTRTLPSGTRPSRCGTMHCLDDPTSLAGTPAYRMSRVARELSRLHRLFPLR